MFGRNPKNGIENQNQTPSHEGPHWGQSSAGYINLRLSDLALPAGIVP
jgi:hypothetical protein